MAGGRCGLTGGSLSPSSEQDTHRLSCELLVSSLAVSGVTFRRVVEGDRERIVGQGLDAGADWMLEADGIAAATGGLLFHYNVPYGDIFMAVAEPLRRRGFGGYLIQQLKRVCYESGRIPAARRNVSNVASRATLQKAGMMPCARVLTGVIPDWNHSSEHGTESRRTRRRCAPGLDLHFTAPETHLGAFVPLP
jgi:GNAT superfamily N-acetyltransferase